VRGFSPRPGLFADIEPSPYSAIIQAQDRMEVNMIFNEGNKPQPVAPPAQVEKNRCSGRLKAKHKNQLRQMPQRVVRNFWTLKLRWPDRDRWMQFWRLRDWRVRCGSLIEGDGCRR